MTIRLSIALSLLSLVYFFCASCSRLGREARIDKGYSLNNVLFVEVDLQYSAYSQHPKSLEFVQQAISRIETIPGVQSAAVVDSLLTSDSYQSRKIYAEGAAPSEMSLRYFAILQAPNGQLVDATLREEIHRGFDIRHLDSRVPLDR